MSRKPEEVSSAQTAMFAPPVERLVSDNLGHCRTCRAAVLWHTDRKGKVHCYDVDKDGYIVYADASGYKPRSHFMTCPDAEEWRQRMAAKGRTIVQSRQTAHELRAALNSGALDHD